jgi:hypothetical protein
VLVDRPDLQPVRRPYRQFSRTTGDDKLDGDQLGATQLLAVERMTKRTGARVAGPRHCVRTARTLFVSTH